MGTGKPKALVVKRLSRRASDRRPSNRKLEQMVTSPNPPSRAPRQQPQSQPQFTLLSPSTTATLHRISSHPTLTPYRRRIYRTLLSVPSGRWTTYAALSQHLSSSARAVGNAMRTNPFAPDVPCHRVLATNRTIGGYKGKWGNGGTYADEKTKLLRGEGVVFDEKGKAGGEAFKDFVDLGVL